MSACSCTAYLPKRHGRRIARFETPNVPGQSRHHNIGRRLTVPGLLQQLNGRTCMNTLLPHPLAGHGRDAGKVRQKAGIVARGVVAGDQPACQEQRGHYRQTGREAGKCWVRIAASNKSNTESLPTGAIVPTSDGLGRDHPLDADRRYRLGPRGGGIVQPAAVEQAALANGTVVTDDTPFGQSSTVLGHYPQLSPVDRGLPFG